MARDYKKAVKVILRFALFPTIILAGLIAAYVHYRANISPLFAPHVQQELSKYIKTIFIISASFLIQRSAGAFLSWYGVAVAINTPSEFDNKLIPLARRITVVVIWVIAVVVILPLYGINISALVATLGVGSLAIALAAQDTISNIIAGFLIMLDAPFLKGDKVKLPTGDIAVVLDVGLRRSTFLSEDETGVIILPNLELSKSKIVNFTKAQSIASGKRKA